MTMTRKFILVLLGFASCAAPASQRTDEPLSLETAAALSSATPLVLRGVVLTPTQVLVLGYVTLSGGRIIEISGDRPALPNAKQINTRGIIAPGFVDVRGLTLRPRGDGADAAGRAARA